jgi:type II secretory pathway component GspD/PulD (secretin)
MPLSRETFNAAFLVSLAGTIWIPFPALAQKTSPPSAPPARKSKAKPAPRTKLNSLPAAKPNSRVQMDFRDASVDDILDFFSVISGLTVIKDPGLQGTATLISPHPIPLSRALKVLRAMLNSRGYDMNQDEDMLTIVPKGRGSKPGDNRKRGNSGGNPGAKPNSPAPNPNNEKSRVFQLNYAAAKAVASMVHDLYPNGKGGAAPVRVSSNDESNTVVVIGSAEQLLDISQIIEQIDHTPDSDRQSQVFPLKYAEAKSVAGIVNDLFSNGGGRRNRKDGGGSSPVSSQPARASSDDYSNSVVVTASSDQLSEISQMIERIDHPVESDQITQVYPVRYLEASDMAGVIANVLIASATGGASGPRSSDITQKRSGGRGAAALLGGQVAISEEANSLVVTANPDDQTLVGSVIRKLDIPQKTQSTAFVRSLTNASAADVALILAQMFGSRSNFGAFSNNFGNRNNRFGNNNSLFNNNNRRLGGSIRSSR